MRRLPVSLISLSLVVAACGGATESETTGAAASDEESPVLTSTTIPAQEVETGSVTTHVVSGGETGGGECTITVTGGVEDTIVHAQSVFTFTSDHWTSEEDLRELVEFMGEDNVGGSYEEMVERGEPIVGWFLYNCVDPDDPSSGVIVYATNETGPDQFPMGPGTYEVSGGLFDAVGPVATVVSNFGVSAEEQFDPVPGSGELVISRWDTETLEGTIAFDGIESFAEGEPREINVMVEFTVICSPQFHSACG
jgi:hypothetical protein